MLVQKAPRSSDTEVGREIANVSDGHRSTTRGNGLC
jgi:hypothetical protein